MASEPRNGTAKPSTLQYLRYVYGGKLPDEMQPWVLEDLTGRGAASRVVAWFSIPCLIIVAPMFLVPASWVITWSMVLLIIIPFVFFAIALNRVFRRYRMQQHGLDPDLLTATKRNEDAEAYADWMNRTRGEREHFIANEQRSISPPSR